jgi:hypothetical protein
MTARIPFSASFAAIARLIGVAVLVGLVKGVCRE